MSITAFVLSLLFFIPLAPLIGCILGIVAVVKAGKDPKALKGLAIAAIIIGAILGVINLLFLFAYLTISSFLGSSLKGSSSSLDSYKSQDCASLGGVCLTINQFVDSKDYDSYEPDLRGRCVDDRQYCYTKPA